MGSAVECNVYDLPPTVKPNGTYQLWKWTGYDAGVLHRVSKLEVPNAANLLLMATLLSCVAGCHAETPSATSPANPAATSSPQTTSTAVHSGATQPAPNA